MSGVTTYVIDGVSSYGLGTTVAKIAEGGLSLTTLTDNFSMNGLGFLYNGLGATWADVRQKVQDLKAVVVPPDITTLTVNNRIQVTDGTNTTTVNPTSITSATFTGALSGNASTATTANNANNVYNSGVTSAGAFGVAYMTNVVGNTAISSDTVGNHLTFNPNTNTLATRIVNITGSATALSAPNATAISFPNANVTATTFTGALAGNATSASTAVSATTATSASLATTASNLTALNPITPSYSYPVSSPSLIGWYQVVTVTGRQFNTVNKAFCCNTTPLPAGMYIMRPYVYCGNSSWYSGSQLLTLVASNSFINNDANTGWVSPSNITTVGLLESRLPNNSGDGIHTNSFVVNNTGASFYPYWAVAVLQQVALSPANNGVPSMNFFRVA
jgi:hypothetical protein